MRGENPQRRSRSSQGANIGYVWALPGGGYEFGLFWAVIIAVFAVLGGGQNSIDDKLRRSEPARRLLPGIIRKVLVG